MLSYLAIRLMQAGHLYTLIIGFAVVAVLLALILAVIGSTFPAMFPTHVRYGAFAIGYNVSTSVFGGTAGVATEFLINHTGDKSWPAYYLMIAAAVAVVPIGKIDAADEAGAEAEAGVAAASAGAYGPAHDQRQVRGDQIEIPLRRLVPPVMIAP